MPAVKSSVVRNIEYDKFTATLRITFAGGARYTYYLVPAEIYDRFVEAGSKGQFFNEHIKDRYRFSRQRR